MDIVEDKKSTYKRKKLVDDDDGRQFINRSTPPLLPIHDLLFSIHRPTNCDGRVGVS